MADDDEAVPEGVSAARDRYRAARDAQAADQQRLAQVDAFLDALRASRAEPDRLVERTRALFRGH